MTGGDIADTFRQEAGELLEALEQDLLDLADDPSSKDLLDSAFRGLHTIKGSGAMFGFTAIADFVHAFETAFDLIRKGCATMSPELATVALQAKDHIAHLLTEGDTDAAGGAAILAALRDIVEDGSGAPGIADGERWLVRFRLAANAVVNGANPGLLLDEIRAIGPCVVTVDTSEVPPFGTGELEDLALGWYIELTGPDPRAAIEDVFLFLRDEMELEVTPILPSEELGGPAGYPQTAMDLTQRKKGEDTAPAIRVTAGRLDELMDRVGELVIVQSRLTELAQSIGDPALSVVAEEFERLTSGLRDTTMGIRMVPIGGIFGRFRRLVHDLSQELGKDIRLELVGEDTEMDKTVVERLADPLVHLIRNSCDHGLEPMADRTAAGKDSAGLIRLEASYRGTEVVITISDDGRGLNIERIRERALAAGLILPDQQPSAEEIQQLVFAPGFSTAAEVTALSGRGVGMDVVKRTIESMRGQVAIASEPGKGSRVTLHLPLTLAIIDALLVRVGDGRFAIPLGAVEECVELTATEAAEERGRSFLSIRGMLVPYIRLRDLFGSHGEPDPYPKVVIISAMEGRVGLVVDQLLGNSQTVIKQLSRLHAGNRAFSGATILGDGSVALILDPQHLVSRGRMQPVRPQLLEQAA